MKSPRLTVLSALTAVCGASASLLAGSSPASRRGFKMISPIASSIRGKIGGCVFSRARGAEITGRALAIPSNPNTSLQRDTRNAAISLSRRWESILTEEEREAWWDLVTGSQTGKSLYTVLNQPRAYAGSVLGTFRSTNVGADPVVSIPIMDTPPAVRQFTDPFNLSYVVDDSANTVTVSLDGDLAATLTAGASDVAPATLLIFGSHQQSPSRLSRQHPMALIHVVTFTEAQDPPETVVIDLAALGMTTQTGKVMYFRGQLSNPTGAYAKTGEERVTITA